MALNNITIANDGYIHCRSTFYTAHDVLNNTGCTLSAGTNKLIGEIDSGNWAVSYLLSMYKYRPKDFVLFEEPRAMVNGKSINLKELSNYSCYMDRIYPMFSRSNSVKSLITKGVIQSRGSYSVNDVKNLFCLSDERFERPLSGMGNEVYRAMAAVGFAHGKELYCFPWLSDMRFHHDHVNITDLLEILDKLQKIAVVPIGRA